MSGQVLDWATAIGDVSGTTFTPSDVSGITRTGDALRIEGDLTNLSIAGFITGSAHFAVTKELVDVDVDGLGFAPPLGAGTPMQFQTVSGKATVTAAAGSFPGLSAGKQ